MRKTKTKPNEDSNKVFTPSGQRLPEISNKVGKVRQSGHLVDQKLKYNMPTTTARRDNDGQISFFDTLRPDLKGVVESEERRWEGIRLTPSEDRLLNAIMSLVKDKSENKDTSSSNFYKGNYESGAVVKLGDEQVKVAAIRAIPAELYKAYLGNTNYSGKEIADIKKTLEGLADKKFLMVYDRTRSIQNGKKTETRIDRIEKTQPLLVIAKATWDMTTSEAGRLSRGDEKVREAKGELIIQLHPILTDQIESKYVEYPQDINRRTIIAAGGDHRSVSLAINTLRDWVLRELSNKRYECQINADKLPYMLKLDNYVKQGRKKLIKETIDKAIQVCKNLNLIVEVTEEVGAEGQLKYVFKLNPDFR